ncbi:serine acetyltransferase [Streptomyces sp. ISL-43]|uniref:serine O-acetyltransferase n=1 Tax=Streptomyces sp. ISL-43 TaxID=2819183 RepID=UPI001BE7DA8F|nr:serine O-acetyltransferase [Streptomyces sp. ISL-43]MBT2450296.1 serine acetyltransferase [Streptomyces sp. ISL-43]
MRSSRSPGEVAATRLPHMITVGDVETRERHAALAAALRDVARPRMRQIRSMLGAWKPCSPELVDLVEGDLLAFTQRDPAAHGSWREVVGSYRCFRAVLSHRLAHSILGAPLRSDADGSRLRMLARSIAEQATVETGVEIHPAAVIGRRFVVDHGMGTVIGETASLGDDCYVLQGVVLGSTGIADNPRGRRHPAIGSRVEIGAFARILGPVEIGDDVVVGCHALVQCDIPAGARVSVLNQYQEIRGGTTIGVTAIEVIGEGLLLVRGSGLAHPGLRVEGLSGRYRNATPVVVLDRGSRHLLLGLEATAGKPPAHVRLTVPDGTSVSILVPRAAGVRRTRDGGVGSTVSQAGSR